jgi:hypothetical protein
MSKMGSLTIDFEDVDDICPHCKTRFVVSRGSVYDKGAPFSIYMAALHECGNGRTAHIGIAIKEGYGPFTEKCAATLQAVNGGVNFEMAVVDPEYSPWNNLDYLGRMLGCDEVLVCPLKETFFHVADHVITENPTINNYLMGQ